MPQCIWNLTDEWVNASLAYGMKRQLSTALGQVSRLFRSCSFAPLNFKCRTSTGYFEMLHTTKISNMLFYFNPIMKSCHSNKNPQVSNGHVTNGFNNLDVT